MEAELYLNLDSPRPRNLILSRMPEDQFRAIARHLLPVNLPLGRQLSQPSETVEHLYFPTSGLISVDALTSQGESTEVGLVGREGFAGLAGLLGQRQMAHTVVMQGAGAGLRIRTGVVLAEFLRGGEFAALIHSFIYLQIVHTSQSVLCNRLHPVEARMERWLLTACDRMQSGSLQLTQEYLGQMLGSRRSTVTVAAGALQREGLIDYTRGRVRVVDPVALEARACECYAIVRSTYRELVGPDF